MINLYHGDCMEAMKKMEDNQYDLAIVDPPYGIGDTWSKSRRDRFHKQGKLHTYQNESPPPTDYFTELMRVSRNQIIWGANYYTHQLPEDNHWIIWDKKRNFTNTFMSECELAWHSFSTPARILKHQWDGYKKGHETKNGIKIHPHQKPINLYKWLLQNYAKPGDKILDTHGGSMSIAIACHDRCFDLDLWELDKDYYDAGVKRFNQHKSQLALFNDN